MASKKLSFVWLGILTLYKSSTVAITEHLLLDPQHGHLKVERLYRQLFKASPLL